jgi:Methyltransferase domain
MSQITETFNIHQGKMLDKWSSYLHIYDSVLESRRDKIFNIIEIGIQNGGSVELWAKIFNNLKSISAIDINPECSKLDFADKRIEVYIGDANSDNIIDRLRHKSERIDLVIDDGSHLSRDIIVSFLNYFKFLRPGGIYIVEDLHCSYWEEFSGGLFHPFSSISFFKNLIDSLNFEHWGIKKDRSFIFKKFEDEYQLKIDQSLLSHIHSIAFFNSMCVITKETPNMNLLGNRLIRGDNATVAPNVRELATQVYLTWEERINQSKNRWSQSD